MVVRDGAWVSGRRVKIHDEVLVASLLKVRDTNSVPAPLVRLLAIDESGTRSQSFIRWKKRKVGLKSNPRGSVPGSRWVGVEKSAPEARGGPIPSWFGLIYRLVTFGERPQIHNNIFELRS